MKAGSYTGAALYIDGVKVPGAPAVVFVDAPVRASRPFPHRFSCTFTVPMQFRDVERALFGSLKCKRRLLARAGTVGRRGARRVPKEGT